MVRLAHAWMLALVIALLAVSAVPAMADAPDPIPSATDGSLVRNADGSRTLTVWGGTDAKTNPGWQWSTHGSDCTTDRSGAGVAIVWNDPTQQGYPVTGPPGTFYVGLTPPSPADPPGALRDPQNDQTVHPTPILQSTGVNQGQVIAPMVEAKDSTGAYTPTAYAKWRGGCGVRVNHTNQVMPDGSIKSGLWNQGTWGPFTHTYPASVTGPIAVCPVMYDVHGPDQNTQPNGQKEVTAGGSGLDDDNSIQKNGSTPQGNGCFTSNFASPDLTLVKQVSNDNGATYFKTVTSHVGDTVKYRFVVTNDGDATTTLTNVAIRELTGPGLQDCVNSMSPASVASLAVGASATFTCTHTMTAQDGNPLINTAAARGTYKPNLNSPAQTVDSNQDTAQVNIASPGFDVTKTVDKTQAHVGDTLTFTITAINTGNSALTVSGFSDTVANKAGAGCDFAAGQAPPASFSLAANTSRAFTCTHVVLDSDPNPYLNTACFNANDNNPNPQTFHECDTSHTDTFKPAFTIKKTVNPTGVVHVGDQLAYTITIKNTGNTVLDMSLIDVEKNTNNAGCSQFAPNTPFTFVLNIGASRDLTCVKSAPDQDSYTNQACATGTDRAVAPATKQSITLCDDVTTTILRPAFTIKKTVNPTGEVHVGDTLNYTIVVTNTGNTSLDFSLIDIEKNTNNSPGCDKFAPGSPATFTLATKGASKTLTCIKAAPDQASYVNQACATGTDSAPQPASITLCDDVTTTIKHPGFKVTKSVDKKQAHVGETVTYTITAINTGDTSLTVNNFADAIINTQTPGCSFSINNPQPPASFTLNAGASRAFTCTHVIADSDPNPYTNVACFDARDSNIGTTPATFHECGNDTTTVLKPNFTITKTANKSTVHVGDQITYTITVSNTGNTDLNFSLKDVEKFTNNAGCDKYAPNTPATFSIAKGGADAVLQCVKLAPNQDSYINQACATGTDTAQPPVSVTKCDDITTRILKPAFTITKTVNPGGEVHVGDQLNYTITVSNTGNADLTFSLKDVEFGTNSAGCDKYAPNTPATFSIAQGGPDQVLTCVKAAPDQPSYRNQACATGTDSLKQSTTLCDDVTTTIRHPGFEVTKTVDKAQAKIGDTLTFTITARNTGDTSLTVTNFSDKIKGTGVTGCTFAGGAAPPNSFTLAASGNAGDTRSFTCTHVLTGSDPVPYVNVACFDARDNVGAAPTKFSECGESHTDGFDPNLTIVKTVDKATSVDNDTLSYTIVVKNTGNATATNVQVTDLIDGTNHGCGTLTGPAQGGNLAAGASITYTCTYKVIHADEDSTKHIVNTATVNGADTNGNPLPPKKSSASTLIQHPGIAIDKSGPATGEAGQKIAYTLTVTNPGDLSFDEAKVTVADDLCKSSGGDPVTLSSKAGDSSPSSFDPGDVWTYTCSVQTKVGDTTVHNIANVCANHPPAGQVCDDDTADTTLTQPTQLLLPERVTPGAARLSGPTGCAAKAFNATVRGTQMASVVYVLDGKVVKRIKVGANAKSVAYRVNPKSLRLGVHRLVVNITFKSGTGTKPKTLRLSFQRCGKKLAAPRFTG